MLTRQEAALIKGMLKRGDRQSDIAAFFGGDVNAGRIAEINTGQKWEEVAAAPQDKLPPPGPYLAGRSAIKARETLMMVLEQINIQREQIIESLKAIDSWEE